MECLNTDATVQCSSGHGDLIAFGVGKNVVVYRTSDLTKGREIARMGFDADVMSVAISPCRTLVVAGLSGGLIEMRSLLDAGFKRVFQGHTGTVRSMLFSMCGSREDTYPLMISGSFDSTVKIWDSATGVCQATVEVGDWVRGVTLLSGGREVLAGTWSGILVVIGMDGIKKREVLIAGGSDVTALACAGDAVVIGFGDGRLQLREAARLDHVIWSSRVRRAWIRDVCVSPSGAEIATASDDNTSTVVSITTGKILRVLRGHTDFVFTVFFTPDGSRLITCSEDKTIRTWCLFPNPASASLLFSARSTPRNYCITVNTSSLSFTAV